MIPASLRAEIAKRRWLTLSEHTKQEEREVERVKEALRTVEKLDLLLENSGG